MNKIITISREYGSGGHSIGKKVAEELGIPFYDKDIMRETATASGWDLEVIDQDQEDVSKAELLFKKLGSFSSPAYPDTQDMIHDVQTAVILKLAKEGPCVILGRCADDILTKAGVDCVNVFIQASDVHRAQRASELTGITNPSELKKLLVKKDNSRHTYYHHYTGKKWGECRNYTLTLDSGALGYDLCAKLIVEAARG